jgi:uncharacterized protein YifE (UPF0438 family)
MNNTEMFMLPREHYLKQPYQDLVNFPDGFEKGGLSSIQARLVRKHGVLINALCDDNVADPNSDDQHLLKVMAGQLAPKTPVEQAWTKYLSLVTAREMAITARPAKTGKSKTKTDKLA